jgi:hypothetical protein
MMNERERLLALSKRRYLDLDIPGLGPWRLQNLQERERMVYENAVIKYDRKGTLDNDALQRGKRLLVQMTSVDNEGNLLFDSSDVDAMAGIDSAVINVICDAARQHVGMTKTDMASLVGPAQSLVA